MLKQIVNPFVYEEVENLQQVAPTITPWLHTTYSQKYEDIIVMSLLDAYAMRSGPLRFGYVEIGANHPIATSSTYLIRQKYGSRGILVEPNPKLAADLRKFREGDTVVEAACVADDSTHMDMVICDEANELSSTDPDFIQRFMNKGLKSFERRVKAVNINEIMEIANNRYQLFYLSIDVEGPDVEILAAINYNAYRPFIIQIEVSETIKPGNGLKIRQIMESAGYLFIANTYINYIFIDAERL